LSDAKEQAERFERDLNQRAILQYAQVAQDNRLLSALAQGFPECAGVALGIDRLVMLATHQNSLSDVIAFPVEEA
jgi:lysyl-tRNA synthetase class 2